MQEKNNGDEEENDGSEAVKEKNNGEIMEKNND